MSGPYGTIVYDGRVNQGELRPHSKPYGTCHVDAATTSTNRVSRAVAGQYTRLMLGNKLQETFIAHLVDLLQWLPGRVHFTRLEYYGSLSARTYARWFVRPLPFVRLAVVT